MLLFLVAAGCVRTPERHPAVDLSERLPGGGTSIGIATGVSFSLPAANLPESKKPDFYAGRALAHQPWVRGQTTTDARDGLGPLYNARTCLACHANGGRGALPNDETEMVIDGVVLLGAGSDPVQGAIPDPTYGTQLQSQSTSLAHQLRHVRGVEQANLRPGVRPEAYPYVRHHTTRFEYGDGEVIELRRPELVIKNHGYGAFARGITAALRIAPPIHGAGLIDAIAQRDIDARADPDDGNGDGISGRVNIAWDFERGRPAPGRFGLKANRVNLENQVAAALAGDMGISNRLFPSQPCSANQPACAAGPHGVDAEGLEISDELLSMIVDFNRSIAVPERRMEDHPMVRRGRELFFDVGCNGCHTPSYTTTAQAPEHLAGQRIWPYTDLLLHDMGPGLADGRPDYAASGREWRTPPLWGVGLSRAVNGAVGLLHDGRARSVEEAIVWHGGEAKASRDRYAKLSAEDRRALRAFVKSL